MEQKNRLSVAIGIVSVLHGLLFAITLEAERAARGRAPTWLPVAGDSPTVTMAVYDNLVMVAGFVLSTVLVFAIGYYFGRRLDLPREYGGVLSALVVAAVPGYGLGRTVAVVWLLGFDLAVLVGVVVPALVIVAARITFVGFAGVALGYLRSSGLGPGRSAGRPSAD